MAVQEKCDDKGLEAAFGHRSLRCRQLCRAPSRKAREGAHPGHITSSQTAHSKLMHPFWTEKERVKGRTRPRDPLKNPARDRAGATLLVLLLIFDRNVS